MSSLHQQCLGYARMESENAEERQQHEELLEQMNWWKQKYENLQRERQFQKQHSSNSANNETDEDQERYVPFESELLSETDYDTVGFLVTFKSSGLCYIIY